jgi:hypothetical protein
VDEQALLHAIRRAIGQNPTPSAKNDLIQKRA